jgi:hypothetical protein
MTSPFLEIHFLGITVGKPTPGIKPQKKHAYLLKISRRRRLSAHYVKSRGKNHRGNHPNQGKPLGNQKASISCHYTPLPKGYDTEGISKPLIRDNDHLSITN